ncbi:MAG: non-canonical purine NTP pyrophosphatase [Candidatus Pacebacteria bacterium]|nr:non-canonical purine NTP pyrophosphatase [Candidatus Paceibacterota bacterium]
MQILFASSNQGKIAEAKDIFLSSKHQLLSVNDQEILEHLGIIVPKNLNIQESAESFQANALIKVQAFHHFCHLPCIADDSGLLLDAYPNFPGVNSNRWIEGSDFERNVALLKKLENQVNRRAKFQTILCLYAYKNHQALFFSGEVSGQIALKIQGTEGFGYDPIFIPDSYNLSFAQLGVAVKNKISHRVKAWQTLLEFLEKN